MATVHFKPLQDVNGLSFLKAVEVRHVEMQDVILSLNLLEAALVDFSSFASRVGPTMTLISDSYGKHLHTIAALPSVADPKVFSPVITMMTQDIVELQSVIQRAAKEDGKL